MYKSFPPTTYICGGFSPPSKAELYPPSTQWQETNKNMNNNNKLLQNEKTPFYINS